MNMTLNTDHWGIDFSDDTSLREAITLHLGAQATPDLVSALMDDAGAFCPEELGQGITLGAHVWEGGWICDHDFYRFGGRDDA